MQQRGNQGTTAQVFTQPQQQQQPQQQAYNFSQTQLAIAKAIVQSSDILKAILEGKVSGVTALADMFKKAGINVDTGKAEVTNPVIASIINSARLIPDIAARVPATSQNIGKYGPGANLSGDASFVAAATSAVLGTGMNSIGIPTGQVPEPVPTFMDRAPRAPRVNYEESLDLKSQESYNPQSEASYDSSSSMNSMKVASRAQGINELIKQLISVREAINPRRLFPIVPTVGPISRGDKVGNEVSQAQVQILKPVEGKPRINIRQQMFNEQANPASAIWNIVPAANFEDNRWVLRNANGKEIKLQIPKSPNIVAATDLLRKTVNDTTALESISPILAMVQSKLATMGYDAMGPLSNNGLPLFLGRYLDAKTGKIRTIKKPNYIFNKYNFNASLDQAMLLTAYRWNQFVASQQKVIGLLEKEESWDEDALAKAARMNLSSVMRSQLISLMKQIQRGESELYNTANPNMQMELIAGIKAWEFGRVANIIEDLAAKYIQANPNMDPLKLKRMRKYVQFSWQPFKKVQQEESLFGMKEQVYEGTTKNRGALTANFDKRESFNQRYELTADPYVSKKSFQMGATRAVADIKALIAGKRDDEIVKVIHQKGLKSQKGSARLEVASNRSSLNTLQRAEDANKQMREWRAQKAAQFSVPNALTKGVK